MKILRPFTVTNDNLASNIAETGSEYSAGVPYALADTVINAAGTAPTHHSYQSLVAANLGNALTDTSKWLDLGPTNRFAMFDNVNGTATTGAAGIDNQQSARLARARAHAHSGTWRRSYLCSGC